MTTKETHEHDGPVSRPSRIGGESALTIVILAVVVLGFMLFSRIWTDLLWYRSVEASQVFRVRLVNTVGLFLIFGALMGIAVWINMVIAHRLRPALLGASSASSSSTLNRYRQVMDGRTILFIAVPSVVLGILAGELGGQRGHVPGVAEPHCLWHHRSVLQPRHLILHLRAPLGGDSSSAR